MITDNTFYVMNYFTDETIAVENSFEAAKKICDFFDGSQVETDTGEILYENIELPF